MKAKPLKHVIINLEYRSDKDLLDMLDQIRKELRFGETKVKSCVKGLNYRLEVLEKIEKIITKPRIETINGNICEVYPSKMN